ncbi:hypothetical protein ARAM_006073 [Aspergillus rambellii]|uniref:Vacuolar iron transporter Ccc1 n=1 Tax=Aspergillus rambellii TaxID=308745 RepID=A0A0F8W8C5_9EURO|nr:hypothetical protein ARAM_006073 [Aspergillus rambellii]
MSLSSIKGLLSGYSPTAGFDVEKDSQDALSETGEASGEVKRSRDGKGFIDGRVISDAIIGLSDGLTVPFALTAGLSALGDTKVVVFGGFAELIAGASRWGWEDIWAQRAKKTEKQIVTEPESVADTVEEIFAPYELPPQLVSELTRHLSASPMLPSFLMNFHHTLEEPSSSRAVTCALTIALGYFVGGFVPLLPYFFVGPHDAFVALGWSIATMVVALFLFGYSKTCFVSGWKGARNVRRGLIGGLQMVLIGGIAAGSAMGLVKGFQALANSESS